MARRSDPEYDYNGSAAVDFYQYETYYGNAAPEIAHPGLPEERSLPRKQHKVKVRATVAPLGIAGMVVVACLLVMVVFGYVRLYEATELVSSLESELSALQKDQVVLESLYEGGIDLEYIEERATELGFSAPAKDQTVYLNLTGSDQAEIYEVEKVGVFRQLIEAIQASAKGLVEYLS